MMEMAFEVGFLFLLLLIFTVVEQTVYAALLNTEPYIPLFL